MGVYLEEDAYGLGVSRVIGEGEGLPRGGNMIAKMILQISLTDVSSHAHSTGPAK